MAQLQLTRLAGSLPAALRKAMIKKFSDFDEYQLAKYNKDKTEKKPQGGTGTNDSDDETKLEKMSFTLKHVRSCSTTLSSFLSFSIVVSASSSSSFLIPFSVVLLSSILIHCS